MKNRHGVQGQDLVYLNTRYLPVRFGCNKLKKRFTEPFEITKVLSRAAINLKLPRTWKTHNVFHVLEVINKPKSLYKHQENISCELETLEDFNFYEVEEIIGHEFRRGKLYFLIKCLGYSEQENTWEPPENLDNCPEILAEYCRKEGIWGERVELVSGLCPVFLEIEEAI